MSLRRTNPTHGELAARRGPYHMSIAGLRGRRARPKRGNCMRRNLLYRKGRKKGERRGFGGEMLTDDEVYYRIEK